MGFVGILDSDKNKLIWSKSILSLAAISEHIKFIISKQTLSISAINFARTSHAEVIFNSSFFKEYYVDFGTIMEDGYERNETVSDGENNDISTYSFLINSKHLAILFKNSEFSDSEYICFRINWSSDAPNNLKYKFLIEIKTKKLIVKKYQTNYQPVVKNKLDVAAAYSEALYLQNQSKELGYEHSEEWIYYMMIEQLIPKQFMDMIPSSTEDFKIEIKNEKISFSGYTNQIMKEKEYLKQPMSVSIALNLDELIDSNLSKEVNSEEGLKKTINFRLRDFKNFMTLISSLNGVKSPDINEEYRNLDTSINEDKFEIFFRNSGDPIMFEYKSNSDLIIQYVQITSEIEISPNETTSSIKQISKRKNDKLKFPAHEVYNIKLQNELSNHPTSETIKKTKTINSEKSQSLPYSHRINKDHENVSKGRLLKERSPRQIVEYSTPVGSTTQSQPIPYSSDGGEDIIGYEREITPDPNKRNEITYNLNFDTFDSSKQGSSRPQSKRAHHSNDLLPKKRIIINQGDQTDYSSSDDEEKILTDLGPTQINNRAKSIFDS